MFPSFDVPQCGKLNWGLKSPTVTDFALLCKVTPLYCLKMGEASIKRWFTFRTWLIYECYITRTIFNKKWTFSYHLGTCGPFCFRSWSSAALSWGFGLITLALTLRLGSLWRRCLTVMNLGSGTWTSSMLLMFVLRLPAGTTHHLTGMWKPGHSISLINFS